MSSWLNLQAYALDKPVEYKKLLLYPATMDKFIEFHVLAQCLLLEKNKTVEGISKPYLGYIYMLAKNGDEEQNLLKFDALLKMCLRNEKAKIGYGYNEKTNEAWFTVDGEKYSSADFGILRTTICEQNDIEIPDETIQSEVRDAMDEVRRMKAKMSGAIPPTLEDQVVCLMVATGFTTDEVAHLSIRKFKQLLRRADAKLHYQVYLTAAMSGFVEFKDKSVLKHWMSGYETDKFKDTMISVESMRGKLAFDDKKQK